MLTFAALCHVVGVLVVTWSLIGLVVTLVFGALGLFVRFEHLGELLVIALVSVVGWPWWLYLYGHEFANGVRRQRRR